MTTFISHRDTYKNEIQTHHWPERLVAIWLKSQWTASSYAMTSHMCAFEMKLPKHNSWTATLARQTKCFAPCLTKLGTFICDGTCIRQMHQHDLHHIPQIWTLVHATKHDKKQRATVLSHFSLRQRENANRSSQEQASKQITHDVPINEMFATNLIMQPETTNFNRAQIIVIRINYVFGLIW